MSGLYTCTNCGEHKAASEFPKDKRKRSGLDAWCKDCHKIYDKARRVTQEYLARKRKEKNFRTLSKRTKVIEGYGGKCSRCGEQRLQMLTIEHIGGVLPEWRHPSGRRKTGENLYNQILKENFPDCLTVLCWNCNLGGQIELRSSSSS